MDVVVCTCALRLVGKLQAKAKNTAKYIPKAVREMVDIREFMSFTLPSSSSLIELKVSCLAKFSE